MGDALGRELDHFGLASIEQLTMPVRSPDCRQRETSAAATYRAAIIFSLLSYAGGRGLVLDLTREALLHWRDVVEMSATTKLLSNQPVGFDRSQVGPPCKAKSQRAGNRNCNTKAMDAHTEE